MEDEVPKSLLTAAVAGADTSGVILGFTSQLFKSKLIKEVCAFDIFDTSATFSFFFTRPAVVEEESVAQMHEN